MGIRIKGPTGSSASTAHAIAVRRGGQDWRGRAGSLRTYFDHLYADASVLGVNPDVLVAQWDLETNRGTSYQWVENGNPAGLGVFEDGTTIGATFGPERAARAHVVHMALYAGILPPAAWQEVDPRWTAAMNAGFFGTVGTTDDLGNGLWATDPDYATKLVERYTAYFGPPQEATMATTYPFNWPGVPGGPIYFSFMVYNKIVPVWRTLQRPGIKAASPREGVQHENGNPNALAKQDSQYLYDGAGGRQASWHATVDHLEGYANLPGDEVGWQAGDGAGPGNMRGFAVELSQWPKVYGTAGQWREARRKAAEVMGRVGARIGMVPPSKRHRDFMLKNCPQYLNLNPAEWSVYLSDWWFYYNDELARMAAGGVADAFTLKVGDRVEVMAEQLNVRVGYSLSHRVTGVLGRGQRANVISDGTVYTQVQDGYRWVNLDIDGFGTGWVAAGFAGEDWLRKVVSDPVPVPVPTYAPVSPVKELLDTAFTIDQKYHTAEGITTLNEMEFIFVADVIEFKRTTPAKQYALANAKDVRAPYQAGERAIAAWLVKSTEGTWWYLLAGEPNEWVRVAYVDTTRVSDAPLLGDDTE